MKSFIMYNDMLVDIASGTEIYYDIFSDKFCVIVKSYNVAFYFRRVSERLALTEYNLVINLSKDLEIFKSCDNTQSLETIANYLTPKIRDIIIGAFRHVDVGTQGFSVSVGKGKEIFYSNNISDINTKLKEVSSINVEDDFLLEESTYQFFNSSNKKVTLEMIERNPPCSSKSE